MNIATDLARALDPARLALTAGIQPDQWQANLLRSNARQMMLLCSRQAGKSTVTAMLGLHTTLYAAPALALVLSPSLRQSQELFRKIKDFYNTMPGVAKTDEESALRMEFTNGSRIVCLPGKEATIRGFSGVSLLIVDEASRVADDLYQAVRPMLAVSGGRIILLSTPFGQRGFFHHEWAEGGQAWHRAKLTAYDCPRIPRDWLEAERNTIGDWWFQQEYLCEFLEAQDQVFAYDDIQRALDHELQPLFRGAL